MFPNIILPSKDIVALSNYLSILFIILFLFVSSFLLLRLWQHEGIILNINIDSSTKSQFNKYQNLYMQSIKCPYIVKLNENQNSNFNDGCYLKFHIEYPKIIVWPFWGVNAKQLFDSLNLPWAKWLVSLNNRTLLNCYYQSEPIDLAKKNYGLGDDITNVLPNNISWEDIYIKRPRSVKSEMLGSAPRSSYPLVIICEAHSNYSIDSSDYHLKLRDRTKSSSPDKSSLKYSSNNYNDNAMRNHSYQDQYWDTSKNMAKTVGK
ncbi:unnamed protein product [Gordionus sp. m RMFG-2023]